VKAKEQQIADLIAKQITLSDFFTWEPSLVQKKPLKVNGSKPAIYYGEWCQKKNVPNGKGML